MSQVMNRATAFCAAGARTPRPWPNRRLTALGTYADVPRGAFVAAVGAAAVLLLSAAPARAAPLQVRGDYA